MTLTLRDGLCYFMCMSYTVKQLALLASISIRTLHFYDEIGLLKPALVKGNGYRVYEENELLKLQQILFFRELEFSLEEIQMIVDDPKFNMLDALQDHRKSIAIKKRRLDGLLKTIDKTISKVQHKKNMKDEELYGSFTKEEMEKYQEEARKKWGHTDAFKQSQERVKKMGKDGLNEVLKESGKLTEEIASCMKSDEHPESEKVQILIAQHYEGLRAFYEPNLEMYRGLGNMYVADERFKATYEKIAEGLAQFMRDAMIYYCNVKEGKK